MCGLDVTATTMRRLQFVSATDSLICKTASVCDNSGGSNASGGLDGLQNHPSPSRQSKTPLDLKLEGSASLAPHLSHRSGTEKDPCRIGK